MHIVCFVCCFYHHHHHLFAQNTIKVDSGYVNDQDRKAHCALTSAHNITLTAERNTHTRHGCDKKSIGLYQCWLAVEN